MICPNCKATIAPSTITCPHCGGNVQAEMIRARQNAKLEFEAMKILFIIGIGCWIFVYLMVYVFN